jgi:hypothetical protein
MLLSQGREDPPRPMCRRSNGGNPVGFSTVIVNTDCRQGCCDNRLTDEEPASGVASQAGPSDATLRSSSIPGKGAFVSIASDKMTWLPVIRMRPTGPGRPDRSSVVASLTDLPAA